MFDDFFAQMLSTGGDNGGWQSWFVIVFIVLGVGVGGWLGYTFEGPLWGIGGALIGAPVGWIFGMFLRGFLVFAAMFLAILAVVLAWTWITGGFAA